MNDWEKSANTFCPSARTHHADAQADLHNVFRRDGIRMMGRVDPEAVASILRQWAAFDRPPPGDIQYWPIDDVLTIPELKTLALHPDITRVAAIHLGAEPKIIDVSLWRSNVPDQDTAKFYAPDGAQGWHRDVDDWRACKLFVYLTDVDHDTGPHMFVPGSHRPEYFEARGMAPDRYFYNGGREPGVAEIIDMMPRMEIVGPAGLMFVANTYAFHRGRVPTKGPRLLFQVCYGLMDLASMMPGCKIPKIKAAWGG